MYKLYRLFIGALFFSTYASTALAADSLKLDFETYERLFLEKNLSLLAQALSVSQEEALLVQERTWSNPSLSLSDINFWTPSKQDSSQQFELAIESLIQTAGKRKQRIRIQELSGQMAVKEYEELLRNLRKEVRSKLAAFVYFQEILPIYKSLLENTNQILSIDKAQSLERTHPKEELLRLQTMVLGLSKEIFDLQQEKNALASELKQFIQVEAELELVIIDHTKHQILEDFMKINLEALGQLNKRPDLQILALEKEQAEAALKLAKAEAYPDLILGASYNRLDGMWKDYIGLGISFDLPIFNRNQGQIRFAQHQLKIQENKEQAYRMQLRHSLLDEYQKLAQLIEIKQAIDKDYKQDLEAMLHIYTQDYRARNINLLAFIDVQEAYLQGQDMLLTLEKELIETWEALQYQIGSEI